MLMVDALKMKRSCVYSINMLHLTSTQQTTAQEALGRQLAEARTLAHHSHSWPSKQHSSKQTSVVSNMVSKPTRDTLTS